MALRMEAPSRFVRRTEDQSQLMSNADFKPLDEVLEKAGCNRELYNRMIGDMLSTEKEFNCNYLPDLMNLGYTPDFMQKYFGHTFKKENL